MCFPTMLLPKIFLGQTIILVFFAHEKDFFKKYIFFTLNYEISTLWKTWISQATSKKAKNNKINRRDIISDLDRL